MLVFPSLQHPVVVKVGGSLFDMPDLGGRLRAWLDELSTPFVILVPGGGATVDQVRFWDQRYGLGEEKAHWLALRGLTFNAHLLASLLPMSRVIQHLDECPSLFVSGLTPILDAYPWAAGDHRQAGCLPHSWDVTSDSLAARLAIQAEASHLVLLKSVNFPRGMDWTSASREGLVDPYFGRVLGQGLTPLDVRWINFRG